MPDDIENQLHPFVEKNKKMSSWDVISRIIADDDPIKLQVLLDQESLELVMRPQDAQHHSTALHAAVEAKATNCLQMLLAANPPQDILDSPDSDGHTPLHAAIKVRNFTAVKTLLKAGVNLNVRNNKGHSALHLAAVDAAATDCLQELLAANPPQDILNSPDNGGNTPLHAAIKVLNCTAVDELLKAGVNPNARNDKGFSALHLLAYLAIDETTSNELMLDCADLLLRCSDIDIKALNNSQLTPLQAAKLKPCQASSLDEFCKKLGIAATRVDERNSTILDNHTIPKNTDSQGVVAEQPPNFAPMFNFLISNQSELISDFLKGLKEPARRKASNQYIGSKTVLYYLVDRCNEAGVGTLLEAGADPWTISLNGELPLHRALARSHFPIVEVLVEEMKKNNEWKMTVKKESFTFIQKALEIQEATRNQSPDIDPVKCLRRLFESDVMVDVNQKEDGPINQTALHIAGAMNNQEAMAILLEHGAYLGERRIIGSQDNGTVIKALMAKTLNAAMNNCIRLSSNTSEEKKKDFLPADYTLEMNYKFLIPPQTNETSKVPSVHNEAAILFDVSQSKEHRNAIKHPLIQTLLYAKWRKVYPLYILNLLLYLTFVILLTAFMYKLKNLRILERMERTGNYTDPLGLQQQIEHQQTTRNAIMVFVLLITVYMTIKEVFQIIFTRKSYFRHIENYLECFLILAVLFVCLVPLSVDYTKHFAAWVMIVAWYEFVLVLGRFPPLTIYITMMKHVSWIFLKLVFLFGFLIIAFSISFNIIMQPSSDFEKGGGLKDFAGFWTSLPRVIVMSAGEFTYSSISEELSASAVFDTSTVLIFLVFLFLIFFVVMNLMTGLAVNDAKNVVEDALLYSLKSHLELIYLSEQLFIEVGRGLAMLTPQSDFGQRLVRSLRKLLSRLQLLDNKQRRLLVKINQLPKSSRIEYGEEGKEKLWCKLDNRTADVIKNYCLNKQGDEKAEREDPTKLILQILQEMRAQNTT